jgi:putative FmdB family regulatory protein
MPIYEYACLECGREFEELVRGDEKPACPNCGKKRLERRMSTTSAHVAGGQSSCPARDVCPSSHCCGPSCGLHG